MFHRLGVDPTKTRPASEALLRRVLQGKGLPRIHPAVDVCNLASLLSYYFASAAIGQRLTAWLEGLRLAHGPVHILGTPRRLVVHVEDLAPGQADLEQVIKGPPADRAG